MIDRRAALDTPHRAEHVRSVASRMDTGRPPKGLAALLAWLDTEWGNELPDRTHVAGVWHDQAASSALGAPADSPPFRARLYGSPYATDGDDGDPEAHFAYPLQAALARLGGRDHDSDRATHARIIRSIARAPAEWRTVATRPHDIATMEAVWAVYLEAILARLWRMYRPAPEARPL